MYLFYKGKEKIIIHLFIFNFFFSFVKQIQEVSVNKMLMRYYYAF